MTDRKDEHNELTDELLGEEEKRPYIQVEYEKELEAQTDELAPEIPEITQKSKPRGHLDRATWIALGKDPNLWKPLDDFNKYGELYTKSFSELRQQNESLSKKIDLLVEDRKKIAIEATREAIQQLEGELKTARDRGDIQAVEHLAKQQVKLDAVQQQDLHSRQMQERREIDELFMQRNGHWFNDSKPDLKSQAQQISQQIEYSNPGISYAQLAIQTEERMRLMHPDVFISNQQTFRAVSMNDSAINKAVSETGATTDERLFKSLTPGERAEYNITKRMVEKIPGIKFTVSEYIEQVKNLNNRGL